MTGGKVAGNVVSLKIDSKPFALSLSKGAFMVRRAHHERVFDGLATNRYAPAKTSRATD